MPSLQDGIDALSEVSYVHRDVRRDHSPSQHAHVSELFADFDCFLAVQDGIDALSEVIYHIETYDVTTIRASTPMFLMSRKIRAIGVKMVLSGEGADEIFGGYLYFHKAPNKEVRQAASFRSLLTFKSSFGSFSCSISAEEGGERSGLCWDLSFTKTYISILSLSLICAQQGGEARADLRGSLFW